MKCVSGAYHAWPDSSYSETEYTARQLSTITICIIMHVSMILTISFEYHDLMGLCRIWNCCTTKTPNARLISLRQCFSISVSGWLKVLMKIE
jgi:hypothetical protein